jgi:hypothetical protein
MLLRKLGRVLMSLMMIMKTNTITAESVYNMLFSSAFEEWNEKVFIPYLLGEENCKSKKDIVKDLEEMLKNYETL